MITENSPTVVEQARDVVSVSVFDSRSVVDYRINPANPVPYTVKISLDLAYSESEAPLVRDMLEAISALLEKLPCP